MLETTKRSDVRIVCDCFNKFIDMNSALATPSDTDVENELINISEAIDVLITATRQAWFERWECLVTLGNLKDKWQALNNVSPNPINAEALRYIEDCLTELTPEVM